VTCIRKAPGWILFVAQFPYFEKIKVGLWDYHAACVTVYPTSASEPVSTTNFINPSHHSVCLYVYPAYRC
jgi:hypothetical protein